MEKRRKKSVELRQRAEAVLLEATPENIATLSPEDVRNTLYSLRVHQLELEMQNEELQQTQAELDLSWKRYFDFYNLAPVGYLTLSATGLIVEANLTAASLLGRDRSALVNHAITHCIHPEDQDLYYLASKKQCKTTDPLEYDLRMVRTDDSVLWVRFRTLAAQDADGSPVCRVVFSDITERKQGEEAQRQHEVREFEQKVLQNNEARFRQVLEHSLDAVYNCNLRTAAYEYVSPVWERLSGYTPEQMMTGTVGTVSDCIHPDDAAAVERALVQSLTDRSGKPYHLEYRFKHKDGRYRWFQDRFSVQRDADGYPVARIGSVSDITARKQAEEVLQEQRFRLSSILGGTRVGTWEWNIQTGAVVFNERWAQMIGYSLADLPAAGITTWERFAHPDDLQQSAQLLARHFAGELPCYDCECRMQHRDGHWIWVHGRGRVFTRTEAGEPLMMFGTHLDITERKQVEDQLVESRENFRRVFENQMVAIGIVDTETLQIVDGNDAFARLFGYSREELLGGMKITDLSMEPEATTEAVHLTVASGKAFSVPLRYHRKKNGEIFPAEVVGETYMRGGRLVTLGLVRDISQRVLAEARLSKIYGQLERKVLERTADLEKTNATLAMMLDYARKTETDIQERLVANLRANILGIVDALKKQPLEKSTQELVELLETTALNLAHPVVRNLESQLLKLSAREMQLANFIRLGKSTKELMDLFSISKKTVEFHRNNLRLKLGISGKKINLRTFLNSE